MHPNDRGFTKEPNLIKDGKWLILLEDATIVETSIYAEF